jgi:hypothetical protein
MRNESDYELDGVILFQNRSYSAAKLMGEAVVVAEGILNELEAFPPGEAEDGCYCPVA